MNVCFLDDVRTLLWLMRSFHVSFQIGFLVEDTRADVTCKPLDVPHAVLCCHVKLHVMFRHKLLAANLTFILGVTVLTVRRVVVSVDR